MHNTLSERTVTILNSAEALNFKAHGTTKSFCKPSKNFPFSPSFWILEEYASFPYYFFYFFLTSRVCCFRIQKHIFLELSPSPRNFQGKFWLHHSNILAAPLHFQVNTDAKSVPSSTSVFHVMICRVLQPSSAQFLFHVSFSCQCCQVTHSSHIFQQLQSTVSKLFAISVYHCRWGKKIKVNLLKFGACYLCVSVHIEPSTHLGDSQQCFLFPFPHQPGLLQLVFLTNNTGAFGGFSLNRVVELLFPTSSLWFCIQSLWNSEEMSIRLVSWV